MYDFKKGNNNEELINKGNRTKEKIDINTIIGDDSRKIRRSF